MLLSALWFAVHRYEWLGPIVSDSLRAIVGTDNVARLQDFAYGVEDRFNRATRKGEAPRAYWSVPPKPSAMPAPAGSGEPATASLPPFRPRDPGPVHESWSAPGDGQWVAMTDPRNPDVDPYLYKTLLHPDRNRSWAELFVVAIDLRRVSLHLVAGKYEPKSFEKEGVLYKSRRTGLVAEAHRSIAIAAFNGGFKTEHGWYGMLVDGVTLVKPRPSACTAALYRNGAVTIATWKEIEASAAEMVWMRQAPGCMYERGKMHVGLQEELATAWGATLDGDTVIRRSAIGLSEDRQILYVGITNSTTARAVAKGMHFAGAADVAQLDVNWSYPKFVTFEPGDAGEFVAVPLAKGFELQPDDYLRRPAHRDFFYLTPKPPESWVGAVPAPPGAAAPPPDAPVTTTDAGQAPAPSARPAESSRTAP